MDNIIQFKKRGSGNGFSELREILSSQFHPITHDLEKMIEHFINEGYYTNFRYSFYPTRTGFKLIFHPDVEGVTDTEREFEFTRIGVYVCGCYGLLGVDVNSDKWTEQIRDVAIGHGASIDNPLICITSHILRFMSADIEKFAIGTSFQNEWMVQTIYMDGIVMEAYTHMVNMQQRNIDAVIQGAKND